MKNVTDKNSAYLETLKKLRLMIAADYTDGGWLPPVRKMSERFGVSDLTYRKAINRLIIDGTVKSYPRKGLYIKPEERRVSKVGFVVGNGEESPFWAGADLTCQTLCRLGEEGFCVHQINASPLSTLPQKALLQGINSLIWFAQTPAAFPIINKIHNENILPLIVVPFIVPSEENDINCYNINHISPDYKHMGKERAKFFIERGHQSIAYIGNFWFAQFSGFADCLKQVDIEFNSEYCLSDEESVKNKLLDLIAEKKITAIISEGGSHITSLFQLLSGIPLSKQPELLIRYHHSQKRIYKKYPNVKLVGIGDTNDNRGTIAADMLCRYLKEGTPMNSMQVPVYYISRDIEHYFN